MRSETVLEPHEIGTYLDAADWLIEVLGGAEIGSRPGSNPARSPATASGAWRPMPSMVASSV